jgi:hypothetical protein
VRCGKPFRHLQAIEAMLGKLAGHAMFQGAALERLKMCGDCRVIDIYSATTKPGHRPVSRSPIPAGRQLRAGRGNRPRRGLWPAGAAVLRAASSELLAQLRVAVTEAPAAGGFLEEPWQRWWAPRGLSDDAIRTEYDACSAASASPRCFSTARTT